MKLNLTRMTGAVGSLVIALVLTGCGNDSSGTSEESAGTAPTSAAQPEGPDEPIDVKQMLISNGFKEERILPAMTNASYWVAPFAGAAELELDGDDTTPGCIFWFTRNDYTSGPVAAYSFSTHHSVAKIKVRTLDPQGAMGPALPQVVEMSLEELTPQSLKDAFADSLPQCGDTTLR